MWIALAVVGVAAVNPLPECEHGLELYMPLQKVNVVGATFYLVKCSPRCDTPIGAGYPLGCERENIDDSKVWTKSMSRALTSCAEWQGCDAFLVHSTSKLGSWACRVNKDYVRFGHAVPAQGRFTFDYMWVRKQSLKWFICRRPSISSSAFGRRQGTWSLVPDRVDESCAASVGSNWADSYAVWQRCHVVPSYVPPVATPRLALFVVHVKSQVMKKVQMRREINTSSLLRALQVHWVGVDARQHDVAHEYISGRLAPSAMRSIMHTRPVGGEHMTQGALGCALSHTTVWQQCAAMDVAACIVFEDDVQLDSSFDWAFQFDLAALPEDWDVWYLASMIRKQDVIMPASTALPSSLFKMQGQTWGTYGYVIRPRAAHRLSHRVWPLAQQVDSAMMAVYRSDNMSVVRSMTNLVTTDSRWGRESLTQVYRVSADPAHEIPLHLHYVVTERSGKQSQAGVARLQQFARAWNASAVHIWGTDEQPLPDAVASLLRGSRAQDSRVIACLALLETSGGTCITDDRVRSIAARERTLLSGHELFFIKGWSDHVLPYLFGARVGHPLVHRMLGELKDGASVSDVLDAVPQRLESGIFLFPPNVFTPLPMANASSGTPHYDEDAVAAFTADS